MKYILGIATLLGGIAAIWFIYEKFFIKNDYSVEDKVVNNNWWESSELKKSLEKEGYDIFGWSNSDKVEERMSENYEVIFDIDKDKNIKYKLVNKSGQVLIGKKST